MRIGVVFPQTEIGADPVVIRDYAQAVEAMGYHHLLIYDHVLGASAASRPDWRGPYTSATMFHEPFVLYGYLAALTQQLELVTGVIILPQRQTALVAKQAAEVDVLSKRREVAEENKRLVKEVLGCVRAAPVRASSGARSEDVVIGQDMLVAEAFDGLGIVPDGDRVAPDLSLRKDYSDTHATLLRLPTFQRAP